MSQLAILKLKAQFPSSIYDTHQFRGDETAIIDPTHIKSICLFLRDDPELCFNMLMDATAVDYLLYPNRTAPRFEVVYHLYSTSKKHRIRLKAQIPEKQPHPELESLVAVWPIANWLEREIWDMYGIRFCGHPDLRRILLYEEFIGFPLRKDYPKEQRQPLVRRPAHEIEAALEKRGGAKALHRDPHSMQKAMDNPAPNLSSLHANHLPCETKTPFGGTTS